MRGTVGGVALGLSCLVGAAAIGPRRNDVAHASQLLAVATDSTVPEWLFPRPPAGPAGVIDTSALRHIPRSAAAFVESRLHDLFYAADWFPSSHPVMPDVVRLGRKPALFACAYCHQPDGSGRPENVQIAGMPAPYIVQQLADMKSRTRTTAWHGAVWVPADNMRKVADAATDEDVAIAAAYFASLKARRLVRVVEASRIPRARPVVGIYARDAAGGTEALGDRLIEMPNDFERHELRDPYVGYVAYVPRGSVARGRALASKLVSSAGQHCGSCHGPLLRGVALVPRLAGQGPGYLIRQLLAFRSGDRSTPIDAPMRAVASTLSLDDMIAVAAYAATLKPQ